MVTNREVAGNETWIAAMLWCGCAFCGFLSAESELLKPVVPCPHCGKSGKPRRTFPDIASVRLLEMISHFYTEAWSRREDKAALLARELSELFGREYEPVFAVKAASEAQGMLASSDGSQAAFEALLEAIRERLGLGFIDAAKKAFVRLMRYSSTNEEHQVVVLLTAAMLEKLFRELLVRVLVWRSGRNWAEARKRLGQIRRQDEREETFQDLVGMRLKEAIGQAGFSEFYDHWQEVRKLRNDFMHGQVWVIHGSHAEKAFELGRVAFEVFARLQNRALAEESGSLSLRA